MEQRPFGSTGISVSALGFGCGAVGGLLVRGDADEQRRAVSRALDAGITYFDTAAQYGDGRSEEHLGRVMRELGAWSRVVVGTKVRLGPQDLSSPETAIRASLEASLRRLGRRDVEVFHLHNPIGLTRSDADSLDMATALGSVARGLEAARQAGLARHIDDQVGRTDDLHRPGPVPDPHEREPFLQAFERHPAREADVGTGFEFGEAGHQVGAERMTPHGCLLAVRRTLRG